LCFFQVPVFQTNKYLQNAKAFQKNSDEMKASLEGEIPQHSTPSSNRTLASFRAISLSVVEEGMNDETS